MLQPLDFVDNSFGLVHARFIADCMNQQAWPRLLRECLRVTRPGGIIRLTECEACYTTSPALQQLNNLLFSALQQTGRSFSSNGNSLGIVTVLKHLLTQAGFEHIELKPYLVDASVEGERYYHARDETMVTFELLKPFFVHTTQLITAQAFDTLYQRALADMYNDDFCAISLIVTASGTKPRRTQGGFSGQAEKGARPP